MRWFFESFIVHLLRALRPRVVVEVGAERGDVTRPLLEWAGENDAIVHVIEPKPRFDVDELTARHPGTLRLHLSPSLRILPRIKRPDLVLIDGDHNWHTVFGELRQLERRAERDKCPPPVVLLHDVEWPYARRDLYYEPAAIPARRRRPYKKAGLTPGSRGVVTPGLNSMLNNAVEEGGPQNGVLTAVEDFLDESRRKWLFTVVPGLHGLGILVPRSRLRRRSLRDVVEWAGSSDFLRVQCHAVEASRIDALIRVAELEADRAGGPASAG
jgi:hypothetical protein